MILIKKVFIFFALLSIIICSLFALTSCSHINIKGTAETEMIINDDFSGQRVISCTINNSDINRKVNGGVQALDDFLNRNCPGELSYEKLDAKGSTKYNFTLKFDNPGDYKQKVSKVMVRKPQIIFSTPNSIFAKGYKLHENFSSEDIMWWFNTKLYDESLMNVGDRLVSYTYTNVEFNGQKQNTESCIGSTNVSYLPVDRIDIETKIAQGYHFKRIVKYSISNETYGALKDSIEIYMLKLVPENAVYSWKDTAVGKVFEIDFNANDEKELSVFMNKILDNKNSYAELDTTNINVFSDAHLFKENLDFTSFPSNKNLKTFVNYTLSCEFSPGITQVRELIDGAYVTTSDTLNNERFTFSKDIDNMGVSLTTGMKSPVKNLSIDTTITSSLNIVRDIILEFDPEMKGNLNRAKEYFEELKIDACLVTVKDNLCIITLTGKPQDINYAQGLLFGESNKITADKSSGFNLYDTVSYVDQLNIKKFLDDIGYNSQVNYKFISDDNIDSCSKQDDGSGKVIRFEPKEKLVTLVVSPSGSSNITITSKVVNAAFIVIMVLIVVVIISILLLVSFFVVIRYRRNLDTNKKPVFIFSEYICSNCKAPIYEDMKYCIKCGKKIKR